MEITLDNSKSAVIPAKIAQEQCKVLVDTGASRCCIREDYFNKIPGTSLALLKGVRIRSATGRDYKLWEERNVPLLWEVEIIKWNS